MRETPLICIDHAFAEGVQPQDCAAKLGCPSKEFPVIRQRYAKPRRRKIILKARLTLNVLLSFAQFERELTGERIRDKVAASKKKDMWMGGVVPLGYDGVDHQLIVNRPEAEIVREIFRQYLRLGCVKELKDYLRREQISSKVRTSTSGRTSGGASYSRGALYHLLNNRVYVGETVHRDHCYPGQPEAIVPKELWDQVAARLAANNQAHRRKKSPATPSLLSGFVFDVNGVRFTPTHATKNGKRYRYYTSQAAIQKTEGAPTVTRFPAQQLEALVLSQIHLLLGSPEKCTASLENSPEKDVTGERALDLAKRWPQLETAKQREFFRSVVRRVVVGQTTVWIDVDRVQLVETLLGHPPACGTVAGESERGPIRLSAELQSLRRGGKIRWAGPNCSGGTPVLSLVKAIARARDWYDRIVSGEVSTVSQLAEKTRLSSTYVKRIIACAALSPQVMEIVLSGKHRPDLTLEELLQNAALDWPEQLRGLHLA
jgi:site-specific DNA recombinase